MAKAQYVWTAETKAVFRVLDPRVLTDLPVLTVHYLGPFLVSIGLGDDPGSNRMKGHKENSGHQATYMLIWNGLKLQALILNKDNFAAILWELYPSSTPLSVENLNL